MNEVDSIVEAARNAFAQARSGPELEDAKASFLGKSGRITQLLQGMSTLSPEEKKTRGAMVNRGKQAVESALQARREAMAADALDAQLRTEALDVTLPGFKREPGGLHPITLATERIEAIFRGMGFEVVDGPEIESDWYSFTALNNPPNHPARSMQDTFYVDVKDEDGLHYNLRPHTSSMQIRHAQAHARKYAGAESMPDIRVIAPGRVFRVDNDATHSPMFHQVEGLWIGENVSFRDLKAMYLGFVRAFFETDSIDIRFRPSFFPFTEPSAEIDIRFAHGPLSGRWLEVSGSGQVHPDVVRNMGLDPERYIGFAFGTGIDRMAMQLYGVGDLRAFFDGNVRFLQQFR